jgi:DNA-binding transcriptional regulator YhcF (GntR family)
MLWTVDHSSRSSLQEQIAGCIRRGLAAGELESGGRLPPAQELAEALGVDRNTVLAAYRSLRDAGLLEFRRGRGVRIADELPAGRPQLESAARDLVELAHQHGLGRAEILRIVEELA